MNDQLKNIGGKWGYKIAKNTCLKCQKSKPYISFEEFISTVNGEVYRRKTCKQCRMKDFKKSYEQGEKKNSIIMPTLKKIIERLEKIEEILTNPHD